MITVSLALVLVGNASAECEDSDGGKDYYTYGEVLIGERSVIDKCSLDGFFVDECYSTTEFPCFVFELFCVDSDSYPHTDMYECLNGCRNGACIELPGESIDLDVDGYTQADGDCDDNNDQVYPDALEQCDELDNDCDGLIDENWALGEICYKELETCRTEGVFVCDSKLNYYGIRSGMCNAPDDCNSCVTNQDCACGEICTADTCAPWAGPMPRCDEDPDACIGGYECIAGECMQGPGCFFAPGNDDDNDKYAVIAGFVIVGAVIGYALLKKK